jgi:hypothetical protein
VTAPENPPLYIVTWRYGHSIPYALDVDGENAFAMATAIATQLAESGRETVTIIEHSSPIDGDIQAAMRARTAQREHVWAMWKEAAG